MAKFTDATGREWSINLNAFNIEAVRADHSVDLLAIVEDGKSNEELQRQLEQPIVLVRLLFDLIKPDVEPEQFAAGLVGDALVLAQRALVVALADFFPKAQRNLILRSLEAAKAIEAEATEKINAIDQSMISKSMRRELALQQQRRKSGN